MKRQPYTHTHHIVFGVLLIHELVFREKLVILKQSPICFDKFVVAIH